MTQVVVNRCWGGFRLSDEAIMLYYEKKGIKLYKDTDQYLSRFYTVPVEEYHRLHEEDRKNGSYEKTNEVFVSFYDFERTDPILIEVIEELGEAANGQFASLEIVEVPDDVEWEISDYDGMESVEEVHRSW